MDVATLMDYPSEGLIRNGSWNRVENFGCALKKYGL